MKAERRAVKRRKKQLPVQKVIFTLILCIFILGCGIMLTEDPVNAHDEDFSGHKYYTSVIVAPGDSLWSIAERYLDDNYESIYDYIDELKDINNLDSNRIQAGQYLTVTYYDP